MLLCENVKARILNSIIIWSEMGQQTTQAKKVFSKRAIDFLRQAKNFELNLFSRKKFL